MPPRGVAENGGAYTGLKVILPHSNLVVKKPIIPAMNHTASRLEINVPHAEDAQGVVSDDGQDHDADGRKQFGERLRRHYP